MIRYKMGLKCLDLQVTKESRLKPNGCEMSLRLRKDAEFKNRVAINLEAGKKINIEQRNEE